MKKILLICASTLLLTACADKQEYEQAVLAEMQRDKDLKDYKIDPEEMSDCVVETTAKEMPGLFPFDPDRLMAYRNYTKMLSMNTAKDKQKTFEELKKTFNSQQELSDAHKNYAKSMVNCLDVLIQRAEKINEIMGD